MAHLWVEDGSPGQWAVAVLDGGDYCLSVDGLTPLLELGAQHAGTPALLLRQVGQPGEQWVLLARRGALVRVNGAPLGLGTRVLRDRDELVIEDPVSGSQRRCFFSTERLTQIEPFPAGKPAMRCPRCKQLLAEGDPAVQCPNPNCGAWYHQSAGRPCWTYDSKCVLCGHPTDLSAGYTWTPEEL